MFLLALTLLTAGGNCCCAYNVTTAPILAATPAGAAPLGATLTAVFAASAVLFFIALLPSGRAKVRRARASGLRAKPAGLAPFAV